MSSVLRIAGVLLVLVAFVPLLSAGGKTKWQNAAKAQSSSAKSKKPVLLLSILSGPNKKDDRLTALKAVIESDPEIAMQAGTFELGFANVYMMDLLGFKNGGSIYGTNPDKVAKYGRVGTVSVYAPGAVKPLFRTFSGKDGAIFKQAREAYDAWRKPLRDLQARLKADKSLKKDADTQIELAEACAKGFVYAKARTYFEAAVKLIKKADKKDPRIAKLTYRAAQVDLESNAFDEAYVSFGKFAKGFKKSPLAIEARLGQAKALFGSGDAGGAKKLLTKLMKDKAAASLKDAVTELMEKIKAKQDKKKK